MLPVKSLVQRGGINFSDKQLNAYNHGAVHVSFTITFNNVMVSMVISEFKILLYS